MWGTRLMGTLAEHRAVQEAARAVLAGLAETIRPADTERTIAARAVTELARRGVTDTWYHGCPALVLLGSRSCLSIPGRSYVPADEPAGEWNLITIDLSPSRHRIWGDCARSLFMEEGTCRAVPVSPEFCEGADALAALHRRVREFATPRTTLDQIARFAHDEVARMGFENLDFLGNFGHSIASSLEERTYLEPGNPVCLEEVPLLTFEPHLHRPGSRWGFKHEEIYRLDEEGRLILL